MADSRQMPPADDAFLDRALRFLDGLLVDDADVRQFNADLAASPDRREAFVRLCELRGLLLEHRLTPAALSTADDDETTDQPALVPPPWFERPVEVERPRRTWPYLALAAAVLLPLTLTLALYVALRPRPTASTTIATASRPAATTFPDLSPRTDAAATQPDALPAATLVATAQAKWADDADPRPGQPLPPGPLDLTAGYAELRLKTGVALILQAPARVDIRPDAMSADLTRGKLTATVPPAARGFAVRTASATVTDYGTEFGVEAAPNHATRVEVFRGEVEAAVTTTATAADPAQGRQRLTKDQAVQVAPDSAVLTRVPPTPADDRDRAFVRDLAAVRLPLPLHNTGAARRESEADPHWQLVADPTGAFPRPRPAYVYPAVRGRYAPNDPNRAQWISVAPRATAVPGGTYSFRTTVDLAGFDPATAQVVARVYVDNYVADVLVNGAPTGERIRPQRDNTTTPNTIHLPPGALRPGLNQVDFVVFNEDLPGGKPSDTALQVEWSSAASPVIEK